MQDWTPILTNRTRHGSFVGKSARDEDAYFAAFAGKDTPEKPQAFVKFRLFQRVTGLFRSARLS